MRAILNATGVLIAVLALAPTAAGQRDARTQQGTALDANPAVGARGYNAPLRSGPSPINSQLYITGQVSGLARFRGGVGYRAPDQLGLVLPGQALRTFRQQSVGLHQVMTGAAYRAEPYLDRAQTVLSLRALEAGLAVPGSNVPRYSTLAPRVADELYRGAVRRYEPIAYRPYAPVGLQVQENPVAPLVPAPDAAGATERFEGVERPGAEAMFRLSRNEEVEELVRRLREEYDQTLLGTLPDSRLDAAVQPRPRQDDGAAGAATTEPPPAAMPKPGQDAFHDLLFKLRRQQLTPRQEEADQPAEPSEEERLAEIKEDVIIIRSLAGKHEDLFNQFMNRAQTQMKAGRFYDAAGLYAGAIAANPRNPMARVGRCLALFAAGESYSAAYELRRALVNFPPLMETQLDIAGMMNVKDFKKSLDDLYFRLRDDSRPDEPVMVFLATYMSASAGNDEEAKRFAKRLRAAGRGDRLYAAYARLILTGKRPEGADGKSSAPSGKDAKEAARKDPSQAR